MKQGVDRAQSILRRRQPQTLTRIPYVAETGAQLKEQWKKRKYPAMHDLRRGRRKQRNCTFA